MTVKDIINYLENTAPLSLQESYDNAGLIIGDAGMECKGVLVALDATEDIINEAIQRNCNLVVVHHPIIFKGLKKINSSGYVGKAVISAIRNNIAVYAIHTNLDNVLHGVNGKMASILNLSNISVLAPRENVLSQLMTYVPASQLDQVRDALFASDAGKIGNDDEAAFTGSGLVGELPEPMEELDFLKMVKERFNLRVLRHTALRGKSVKRVALCGGAGSFLIVNALAASADVFLTADLKYHEFFDAEGKMVLADLGHYESEQFTINLLFDLLQEKFTNFAVLKTGLQTNPVHYLI